MTCDPLRRVVAALALALLLIAFVAAQSPFPIYANQPADHINPNQVNVQSATLAAQPAPAATVKAANFARAVSYSSGGYYASSVALADLDGDGDPDLVVANSCQSGSNGASDCAAGGEIGVLLTNGNGTFQSSVTYPSGGSAALSVAVADVNGDGIPDLIVANECVSSTDCTTGNVGILLGVGNGTFRTAVNYPSGYGSYSVAVADLNGDGHLDLAVANQCVSLNSCNNGAVTILLNNGNGTFQPGTTYSSGGQGAVSVAIKDLNGDGFPDIILANQCLSRFNCNIGGVSILLGNGDGTLRTAVSYDSGGYSALSVAVADVNGDGHPDIIATSLCSNGTNCVDGVVAVLLNKGSGTFQQPTTYSSAGYGASSVAIGDINGDGIPDLVVDNICKTSTNCTKGGVVLLVGNGDGTFQTPLIYSSNGNNATSVALGDLNGDGKPDIVTANDCTTKSNCSGLLSVLLNSSALKTTTTVSSSSNPSSVGQQVTFTATITSTSQVPDGETVTFYQGAVVLGTSTTTNGTASFATSFSKAATYTIKAEYAGDAFHKASTGKVKQVVNNPARAD
jgi:hypothetical protein